MVQFLFEFLFEWFKFVFEWFEFPFVWLGLGLGLGLGIQTEIRTIRTQIRTIQFSFVRHTVSLWNLLEQVAMLGLFLST